MSFKEFVTGPIKYCFLDFDGTIRQMGGEHAPTRMEDVKVFPWVHDRLQELKHKGYTIVGVTNQSYVTQRYGEALVKQLCDETVRQTGISFPYIFAHTRAQSKPSTYMVDQIQAQYGPMNKETSIFVGDDLEKDKGCADNLGIRFISAEEFKNGIP